MAQEGQLYFAYGANMNRAVLAKRGVKPLAISPAKLLDPSLALCFQHRGGFGTLTAALCPSDCEHLCCIDGPVHGMAMQVDAAGWTALRDFETGYTVQQVELQMYGPSCRLLKALAFVSQRQLMLRRPVAPPARYLKLLREGAAQHGLDLQYQAKLAACLAREAGPLPDEYFDTPSKWTAAGICAAAVLVGLACLSSKHNR